MRTMSSAEFRKTYPRLDEEVVITANGHAIGRWVPAITTASDRMRYIDQAALEAAPVIRRPPGETGQAKRDAILRKINKGG